MSGSAEDPHRYLPRLGSEQTGRRERRRRDGDQQGVYPYCRDDGGKRGRSDLDFDIFDFI